MEPDNNTSKSIRLKRLLYQSNHRGCKETDMILGEFAKVHLKDFTEEEIDLYEKFINESDYDIYAWLTNSKDLPEKYDNYLINMIKAFNLPKALRD